jgi:hypothetical protein
MKYTKRRLAAHTTLVAFLSLGLLMCSSDGDDDGEIEGNSGHATGGSGNTGNSSAGGSDNTGASSAGGSGNTSTTGGSTGSGGGGNIQTSACNGLTDTDATIGGGEGGAGSVCAGVGQEAEPVPVDILLVMDRSTSMGYEVSDGVTRLNLLSDAIQSYAADPDATEIGTGIVFFRALGATSSDEWCDPVEYETPDVPIGLLSDNADEITAAIDAIEPGGLTPSVPALEGAVAYAQRHAAANPDRATVVALVSDAFPTECNNDPVAQSDIARAAYEGDPSIPVYAIGVGASARLNLDNVARAGGTQQALMTEDGTAAEDFVAALKNITLSDLKCEFRLPDPPSGMDLQTDPDSLNVQVVYSPSQGDVEEMPYVGSLGGCGASDYGGWYFDNTNEPTSIRVCPCTCTRFGAGVLEIRIGCAPVKIIT